jgi:hypothetical protein
MEQSSEEPEKKHANDGKGLECAESERRAGYFR